MSTRSRERKLRTLEEKQAYREEIRVREMARTEPMRKLTKRIALTIAGTVAIVLLIVLGVAGGKYLMSGQLTNVTGPFGEISQTELADSRFVTLKTNRGDMKLELDVKNTPKTAANFILLAKKGFYDGTKFHRIMKDFMIQGGDPNSKDDDPTNDGQGGPGYKFDNEKVTGDYTRGTLAMANAGVNTNGSQFFIMHADNSLPKDYVIFGHIVEGLDVLDAIANTPVTNNDADEASKPLEDIIVESVIINDQANV